MRFAQEKRRLLGWLALLAPLPLPLNEPRPMGVVTWPVLLLWVVLIGDYLRRVRSGQSRWLGNRALNLLGLAYLPILALDLSLHSASLLIRPMMHLALFALAAKLFSLDRERDKWHALFGILFVFVSSMATSTSIGIIVYLAVFLPALLFVLRRLATLHMESFETERHQPLPKVQRSGRLLVPVTFLLMIPIFGFLPRFGNPFIFGSAGSSQVGTGFSDEVRLDGIGRIRSSSAVAMRITYLGDQPSARQMAAQRFRGATYDLYLGDRWERSKTVGRAQIPRGGVLQVSEAVAVREAEVWLEPLNSTALILPVETARVRGAERADVLVGRGGALSFIGPPREAISYRVELASSAPQWAGPPAGSRDPTLDENGIGPRIRALAAQVAGDGSAALRAATIEQHLQTQYEYELELLGGVDEQAVERFLFERQAGHCEYFASAMVLMLRSQGIPARFVTGFLGVESTPLGYGIVRQSGAHAWVEAYLGDEQGWVGFDPTPPAGRPLAGGGSVMDVLRQSYDWLIFSWDRYVVGFGVGEQQRLWSRVRAWLSMLFVDDEEAVPETGVTLPAGQTVPQTSALEPDSTGWRWIVVALVAGSLAAALWIRRRRYDARVAYLQLRRAFAVFAGEGSAPPPTPLEFADDCARRVPQAAEPTRRVVEAYVRESFGGRDEARSASDELRRDVARVREALRRSRRAASSQDQSRAA